MIFPIARAHVHQKLLSRYLELERSSLKEKQHIRMQSIHP